MFLLFVGADRVSCAFGAALGALELFDHLSGKGS